MRTVVIFALFLPVTTWAPPIDMMHESGESGEIDATAGERKKPEKPGFFGRLFGRRGSVDSGTGDSLKSGKGSGGSVGRSGSGSLGGSSDVVVQQKGGGGKLSQKEDAAIARIAQGSHANRQEEQRPREQTEASVKSLSPTRLTVLRRCLSEFPEFNGKTDLEKLKKALQNAKNVALNGELADIDALLKDKQQLEAFVRLNREVQRILDAQKLSPIQKRLVIDMTNLQFGLRALDGNASAVRTVTLDLIDGIVGKKVVRRENTTFTGVQDTEGNALRFLEKLYEGRRDNSPDSGDQIVWDRRLDVVKKLLANKALLDQFMDAYHDQMKNKYEGKMSGPTQVSTRRGGY